MSMHYRPRKYRFRLNLLVAAIMVTILAITHFLIGAVAFAISIDSGDRQAVFGVVSKFAERVLWSPAMNIVLATNVDNPFAISCLIIGNCVLWGAVWLCLLVLGLRATGVDSRLGLQW